MKKGSALIFVLMVMTIITLGTATILQAMISYIAMREITAARMTAQYLTEAGACYGVMQCVNGNFTSPVTINSEKYPITINKDLSSPGNYNLTVTVTYPGA